MELTKKIVIAIDGFSSCGKSSFAKLIAKKLSYIFIDTGAMYRAVSFYAIQHKLVSENHINSTELIRKLPDIMIHFERTSNQINTYLNAVNVENEIRGVEVSGIVSEVSKIKEVRQYLVNLQQTMGKKKGVVMDGRDIGTVVFPNAEIKIFMTASSEVRAQRRYDELKAKGINVSFDEIRLNIESRDKTDLQRKESPLRKAEDAMELDNSNMSIEEQMIWFEEELKKKSFLAG